MPRLFPLLLTALVASSFSASAATADYCKGLKSKLKDREFVTLESLYDTVIGPEGVLKREDDKEELLEGERVRVVGIECDKKRINLELRPVERRADKQDIYFEHHRDERDASGAEDTFWTMLGYVLEEPE